MNASIQLGPRRAAWFGRRKRQDGGETVEFTILAIFVFLLLFAIVEFSIAMYDQGTLVHGARLGAREASLYWIDVEAITPDSDPEDDQRVKPDWIEDTITSFVNQFVVSFTGATTEVDVFHDGVRINDLDYRVVGTEDAVWVDLSLLYRAPVTSAIAGLMDMNMGARPEMRVE